DWSSDVCSSDLSSRPLARRLSRCRSSRCATAPGAARARTDSMPICCESAGCEWWSAWRRRPMMGEAGAGRSCAKGRPRVRCGSCRIWRWPLTSRRATSTPTDDLEAGAALVLVMVVSMLVVAVGMSLLLVMDVEATTAGHQRDDAEVRYVADAGLDHVIHELAVMADWTIVLAGPGQASHRGARARPA